MPRQSSLPSSERAANPNPNPNPEEEFRAAMDAALGFLTARARSCSEVRQHLTKKGHRQLADRVEVRLAELGLLDDLALARSCVEQAVNRRGAAPGGLAPELVQRGIDPAVASQAIEEALSTFGAESGAGRPDLDLALEIATKRLRVLHGDPAAIRRRLWGFLARRGYEREVVQEVCSRLLGGSFD